MQTMHAYNTRLHSRFSLQSVYLCEESERRRCQPAAWLGAMRLSGACCSSARWVDVQETMRELSGAIIGASLIQVAIGYSGLMGFLLKYISPLTIAPTIALVGLALIDAGPSPCPPTARVAVHALRSARRPPSFRGLAGGAEIMDAGGQVAQRTRRSRNRDPTLCTVRMRSRHAADATL